MAEEGKLQNCASCGKYAYTFVVHIDKDLIECWCQSCISEHDDSELNPNPD